MTEGEKLAKAARALVGARFRLHGRDPETGLDCIGVLATALASIGRMPTLPVAYTLRTCALPDLATFASACGLTPATGSLAAGDVLLVQVCACQFHLLIAVSRQSFVHAHAGLRRVVEERRIAPWPVAGHWRLDPAS